MVEIEKSVLGSVRLDSDIWEAVRAMPCSLNRYLRSNLLGEVRVAGPQGTVKVERSGGKVSATVNVESASRKALDYTPAGFRREPLLKPGERKRR